MTHSEKKTPSVNELIYKENSNKKKGFFIKRFLSSFVRTTKGYFYLANEISSSPIFLDILKKYRLFFVLNLAVGSFNSIFSTFVVSKFYNLITKGKDIFNLSYEGEERKNIAFFLILNVISSQIDFFDKLMQNKIENDSFYFIKEKVKEKFFSLKLEQRFAKKADVSLINDKQASVISENWNHTPNHFVISIIKILSLFIVKETRRSILELDSKGAFTSLIFVIFMVSASVYFSDRNDKNREHLMKLMKDESCLTEKAISNSVLIDSMGLKRSHFDENSLLVEKVNKSYYKFLAPQIFLYNSLRLLGNVLPMIVIFAFPSIPFSIHFVNTFKEIANASIHLGNCYKEAKDLSFSLKVVKDFMSLPEKSENPSGFKLSKESEIASITFENICFSYEGPSEKNNVISNYNNHFSKYNLNRIEGKNGIGKSTILYLILGMIEQQKGKIIVSLKNGKTFNINDEVNLSDWKENVVAYVSHENLFSQNDGSTGQRQLMNIDKVISNKKSAQIYLFDEAENSLDEENKEVFYKKINQLVSNNKLVILVSH